MKAVPFPVTVLVFLTFCSPGNDRRSDTGMARSDTGAASGGAGGFSSHDTMPSSASDTAGAVGAATTPVAILSELYAGNTVEIQLSKQAEKQARSPKVKQVAAKLASDHGKNREQVKALAQKLNISLTPSAGGGVSASDSTAIPPDLQGKSGADFDRAFVAHEIQEHQKNIEQIQNQLLPAAQDPQVKAYLQKTLSEMQGHLTSLQAVQKHLS